LESHHSFIQWPPWKTNHILEPGKGWAHERTVILLHCRDSTAQDFAAKLFNGKSSDNRSLPEISPTTRWVFPTLEIRKSERFVTHLSQGLSQRVDTCSVEHPSEPTQIQHADLKENTKEILQLILAETSLISPQRIILGGINQGCATAIPALLCIDIRLSGFLGFPPGFQNAMIF
jgi:lysophospholipase-2